MLFRKSEYSVSQLTHTHNESNVVDYLQRFDPMMYLSVSKIWTDYGKVMNNNWQGLSMSSTVNMVHFFNCLQGFYQMHNVFEIRIFRLAN